MNTNNTDKTLMYPDFDRLFSSTKEIRKAKMKTVVGVDPAHFVIYFSALIISVLLIIPYILDHNDTFYTILMSIGASGVGAALLGYFNELAIKGVERNRTIKEYNDYIATIYFHAYKIFGCSTFTYMKNSTSIHSQEIWARQNATKILHEFQIIIPKVESFIFNYYFLFDGETTKFYQELNDQLTQFEGSLQNPVDILNLIDVMEGIRLWLRKRFELDNLRKQFLR